MKIINVLEKRLGYFIKSDWWVIDYDTIEIYHLKSLKSLIEANRIGRSLTDIQVELVADLKDEIPIRLVFILELGPTYANSSFA